MHSGLPASSSSRAAEHPRTNVELVFSALQSVLTLGEQLRQVYEKGTDAARRMNDLKQTKVRAAVFGVWCLAVAAVEIKRAVTNR